MAVRVMVFAQVKADGCDAFEAAFAEVTRRVRGTPGHVRDELLRGDGDGDGTGRSYVLLSEWESREAFLVWEDDPIHRQTTTPMRPYWQGAVTRHIYDVAVRLDPAGIVER
jgi:heme-degrading monooxygenase HmoA